MAQHAIPRDRLFPARAVILCEQTAGENLYIIKRGRVQVVKRGRRGEVVLGELGPGNLFGEMALIDRRLRSASVIALEETLCIELPYTLIADLVDRASPWIAAMLRIPVLRLRAADDALADARINATDSGEIPIDKITERHLRRIVRTLEDSDQLEWAKIAAEADKR